MFSFSSIFPVGTVVEHRWRSLGGIGFGFLGLRRRSKSAPCSTSVRRSFNVTDNLRIFARWSNKAESKTEEAPYYGASNPAGPGSSNPNNRLDGAAGLTWVFNPTTVFSLNAGYNHWFEGNVLQSYPFDMTSLGLPGFINQTSNQFPVVASSGYAPLGPQNGAGPGGLPRNDLTWSADVNKVKGSHSLSVGQIGRAHV